MSPQRRFAYFDGDDVGRRLELLLLDDRPADAAHYSCSIERARAAMVAELTMYDAVELIFSGGDDVFISFDSTRIGLCELEQARQTFRDICGQCVSVGVGPTPSAASSNLRRAKLSGKDRIIFRGEGGLDGTNN